MITAIVLYDLPPSIGLEECRAYFTKIAPDFFKIPGFLRKQFICARAGKVAGGVYMWESQEGRPSGSIRKNGSPESAPVTARSRRSPISRPSR